MRWCGIGRYYKLHIMFIWSLRSLGRDAIGIRVPDWWANDRICWGGMCACGTANWKWFCSCKKNFDWCKNCKFYLDFVLSSKRLTHLRFICRDVSVGLTVCSISHQTAIHRFICHVLQMSACQRLKILFLPLKFNNKPTGRSSGRYGYCAAGKESDKFAKPSGSNLTSKVRVCAATSLNRICLGVLFVGCHPTEWGGAAAIAVNHTCIKLVATISTQHDADAAAVATAEECIRIADTSVDRVQCGSRLHSIRQVLPFSK